VESRGYGPSHRVGRREENVCEVSGFIVPSASINIMGPIISEEFIPGKVEEDSKEEIEFLMRTNLSHHVIFVHKYI